MYLSHRRNHGHVPSAQSAERDQTGSEDVRGGLPSLFSGRSRTGRVRNHPSGSPKPPRLVGRHAFPSTRIDVADLASNRSSTLRSFSQNELLLPRHEEGPPSSSFNSRGARLISRLPQIPGVATIPRRVEGRSERRFVGVDPAEQHLADLARTGRRRRRKHEDRKICLPNIRNKKIRAKMVSSLISGIFLTLVFTVYLALALSDKSASQEFHVFLILIILIITMFFCHSLIRLGMMIIRPPLEDDHHHQSFPSMVGPNGYAEMPMPIRVALARDEEAAGIESEATKVPPPAYGLWRESVRVDPNRIYWQRNEAALDRRLSRLTERRSSTNRPPSYMSDDGVSYVVEAAPRSTAPTDDIVPPHPAERLQWPRS